MDLSHVEQKKWENLNKKTLTIVGWVLPNQIQCGPGRYVSYLCPLLSNYGMLSPVPLVGQQQQLLFAIEPVTCNPSFSLPVFVFW